MVEAGQVLPITGSPFGTYKPTGSAYPLEDVKLLIPVVPPTFYCVGINYADHIRKMAAKRKTEPVFPKRPDIGYRANNALIAHEENIVKPADAGEAFQYEGELVAVFGKRARHVSRENALDYVLGWTIGNDVSERSWQAGDRTLWRAKNADTFKPMGPWIETSVDLDRMETIVRVNGRESNRFHTNEMIFGVREFIVELTKYFTLWPGDVIWMGTDGASPNIKAGDTVEIEITGIGTLRNKFVAEVRGDAA
jgi:2-keto-4-pentenoate hydratase/2-oxohepta-3-ene-1,7-dioic acid hydratase in catechol pathway